MARPKSDKNKHPSQRPLSANEADLAEGSQPAPSKTALSKRLEKEIKGLETFLKTDALRPFTDVLTSHSMSATKANGRCLVLNLHHTPAGKIVVMENPLFNIPNYNDDQERQLAEVERVFDEDMTDATKLAVTQLYYRKNLGNSVRSRFISCGYQSSKTKAWLVYDGISLINHSCKPNSFLTIEKNGQGSVVLNENLIEDDSEITISYLSNEELLLPTAERNSIFKERYGSYCHCDSCKRVRNGNIYEDEIRAKAKVLVEKYDLAALGRKFYQCVDSKDDNEFMDQVVDLEEAVLLLQDLRFSPYLANAYAAGIYIYSQCRPSIPLIREAKMLKYCFDLKEYTRTRGTMFDVNAHNLTGAYMFGHGNTILELHVICKLFADMFKAKKVHREVAEFWKDLLAKEPGKQNLYNRLHVLYAKLSAQRDQLLSDSEPEVANAVEGEGESEGEEAEEAEEEEEEVEEDEEDEEGQGDDNEGSEGDDDEEGGDPDDGEDSADEDNNDDNQTAAPAVTRKPKGKPRKPLSKNQKKSKAAKKGLITKAKNRKEAAEAAATGNPLPPKPSKPAKEPTQTEHEHETRAQKRKREADEADAASKRSKA
jgi:hypothetical protein